jgi:zinc transporter ZupT
MGFSIPLVLAHQISSKRMVLCGCDVKFFMQVLLAFSAGVLLCISLVHLLAEAAEVVNAQFEYPLAYVLFIAGIFISLASEQFGMALGKQSHHKRAAIKAAAVMDAHSKSKTIELPSANTKSVMSSTDVVSITIGHQGECEGGGQSTPTFDGMHHHHHALLSYGDKDMQNLWSFIKAIVMEISIAVHSIIMGLALGLMVGYGEVVLIMIIFGIHQFFEGIGLGISISESALSAKTKAFFGFFFAVTLPLGIVCGLIIETVTNGQFNREESELIQGYCNCIAAGTLLHIAYSGPIQEVFNHENAHTIKGLLVLMMSFSLGVAVMAYLAVWG